MKNAAKFNKVDAMIALIREARSEKASAPAYKRSRRALTALGFNEDEQDTVLSYLDYHSGGQPYPWLAKALAEKVAA